MTLLTHRLTPFHGVEGETLCQVHKSLLPIMSSLSDAQRRALALLPKVSGLVSALCSALIVYSVLHSPQKRSRAYHRLLLGIAIADISNSFWFGLSTWPIPDNDGASVMYTAGTPTSCEIQGFFIQWGNASGLYNASLALYYLLVLRYGWNEAKLQQYNVEPYLHGFPLIWATSTACLGIPLRLYNNANLWCWIAPYPAGCNVGDDYSNCLRGQNADMFRWMFYYGPLWCSILFVTVSMTLVFFRVTKKMSADYDYEGANKKNETTPNSPAHSQAEGTAAAATTSSTTSSSSSAAVTRRQVALQCFLYASSFYLNWMWMTAVRILQAAQKPVPYGLLVTAAAMTPLFGLPNVCVYLFPSYLAARQEYPQGNVWAWIQMALS